MNNYILAQITINSFASIYDIKWLVSIFNKTYKMSGSLVALLYRNMLLFYKLAFISCVLIGLLYLFANDSPSMIKVLSFYIVLFPLQYIPFFCLSLVNDRFNKFRITYQIMGLSNASYILANLISFVAMLALAFGAFFGVCHICIKKYDINSMGDVHITLLKASPLFLISLLFFYCCLSYTFRSPKSTRDFTALIIFCMGIWGYQAADSGMDIIRFFNPFYLMFQIIQHKDKYKVAPELKLVQNFLPLALQCVVFVILLFYIDYVHPSGSDHQKSPFFFLKIFSKSSPNANDLQANLADDDNTAAQHVGNLPDGSLAVFNLQKRFGKYQVLKGIDAVFQKGKVHSLLGHNGAGKSTFINMLTGIYQPSQGSIIYDNKNFRDIRKTDTKALNIGICPSYDIFSEELTVYNHLKIIAMIKRLNNVEFRINEIIDLLGISQYKNFAVSKLSGGTKRKVTIGIAIMSKPSLLFLDEPTSAIDPISRQEIWKVMLELKKNTDMVTILTTHHLEEAEVLSDSINVLGYGKLLVTGTVDDIKQKFGIGYTIAVNALGDKFYMEVFKELKSRLVHVHGISDTSTEESKLIVKVPINKIKEITHILKTTRESIPSTFKVVVDSNTLEQAYFEIDRIYQTEEKVPYSSITSAILESLYSPRQTNCIEKIWLVMINKLLLIVSNPLELIKVIITYAFMIIAMSLISSNLMKSGFFSLNRCLQYSSFVVYIELILSCFSAYNVVCDKANNLKTIMFINKITPLQYYLGKYFADMFLHIIGYSVVFISMLEDLRPVLTPERESKIYCFFFTIFMWRAAVLSYSYLASRLFENPAKVLTYYFLVYYAYLQISSIAIMVLGFSWMFYINETMYLMISVLTQTCSYKKSLMVFGAQILFYFTVNVLIESYTLKKNYICTEGITQNHLQSENVASPFDNERFNFARSVKNEANQTIKNPQIKLRVVNLRKEYGENKVALNNVTFNVDHATHFGLIGENGAGKSTTFNMILNRILKTSGDITVDKSRFSGIAPFNPFAASIFESNNTAACFQGNAVWEDMTAAENLNFFAILNNVQPQALAELVNYFDFGMYVNKSVSELSTGNQRKLCIIISLLINPAMVFFDEATCGVDLIIRLKLKHLFDELKTRNGCMAIFTTHFLKDVELFCDKIGIIKNGNFLCIDTIDSIKQNLGGYRINFKKNQCTNINKIFVEMQQFGSLSVGFTDEMKNIQSLFLHELNNLYALMEYLLILEARSEVAQFTINSTLR